MKSVIEAYRDLMKHPLNLHSNWENLRFVSIDSESTGLDPRKDRLISVAGIGIRNGEIQVWDQFSVVMPIAYNTSAVTVHGITREEAASGTEEPEALAQFLPWCWDAVIVGHHIGHDVMLLNAALERHFSLSLRNTVIDTMEAFLAVKDCGGFKGLPEPKGHSLDALCERFHIVPHDRHTASGDAFLTAMILLRTLKEAIKMGLWNLADLGAKHAYEQPVATSGN